MIVVEIVLVEVSVLKTVAVSVTRSVSVAVKVAESVSVENKVIGEGISLRILNSTRGAGVSVIVDVLQIVSVTVCSKADTLVSVEVIYCVAVLVSVLQKVRDVVWRSTTVVGATRMLTLVLVDQTVSVSLEIDVEVVETVEVRVT